MNEMENSSTPSGMHEQVNVGLVEFALHLCVTKAPAGVGIPIRAASRRRSVVSKPPYATYLIKAP